MLAVLTALALAANPPPKEPPKPALPPAEQIRLELNQKVVPLLLGCNDLIQVAGVQSSSSRIDFHVGPTGKVTVRGNPPNEAFAMLVWRCGVSALAAAPLSVKVKGVTTVEAWSWDYSAPPEGNGLAWVADDPKKLDREVLIASDHSTWLRCEHKDAALTTHGPAKDVAKLMALPDFQTPIEDSDSDVAPFWKAVRTKGGKHDISTHRGALPAFAKPIEVAAGVSRACDPVRALGDKAAPLLLVKATGLAACLKHRHNDLWLTLTLNGSGAVTKADARATAGLDDKQLDCLEKIASKWGFPYKGESGATLSAHLQAAPPGE